MTGERYRIPVFELEAPPYQGAAVRLTRMEAKPAAVDDVIEVFRGYHGPAAAGTPGAALRCCSPATMRGHLIGQAVWQDSQAQAASQGTAAVIRPASWTQRPA